ncbi:MAG: SHOCT domain-containing protein [Solirubrobacteraceae bacterium]
MPLRRRRPMLRAAAVGGGAYLMGKRHAERSAEQSAEQAPAPAQDTGGLSSQDMERLQQLAKLNKEGVITDEELAEQKARILG